MSTIEMARAERRDLADFCAGLAPQDWDAPSLCTGWRVRDVVAHVVTRGSAPSWGAGPEARGPGEAVLMAAAGRRSAAGDLHGPGADVLRRRLG